MVSGLQWLPRDLDEVDPSCEEVETVSPVRVSLGGGGTDMLAYAGTHGGSIVSLAINRFVRLRMTRSDRDHSRVRWAAGTATVADTRPLRLVSRVLRVADPRCRYDVELSSDQNFGSGLGTSSSLVVSLLLALEAFHGVRLTAAARAAGAFVVERVLLAEAGGYQDQLASAFGGFNHYRFTSLADPHVEAVPGDVQPVVQSLLLCDSGIGRSSSAVLAPQLQRIAANRSDTIGCLHGIRQLSFDILAAVSSGDLDRLAACIDDCWRLKQEMNPRASDSRIDSLIDLGRAAGALAARVLGAGAGGHVLFVVPPGCRESVAEMLRDHAGVPFTVRVADAGAHLRYAGRRRGADGNSRTGPVLQPVGGDDGMGGEVGSPWRFVS